MNPSPKLEISSPATKKKESKKRECIGCGEIFASPSSLSNHKKKCKRFPTMVTITKDQLDRMKLRETALAEEIQKLKNALAKLELENKDLHAKVDDLTDKLLDNSDKFADIAVTSTATASKSVSAITYVMANFRNAPELKPIENLSALTVDYDNNTKFILDLISLYKNGTLVANLGEFIVNRYKKEDCSLQSLWSSDVSRLSYIISEAVKKNKTTWTKDKKGIKVVELIIRPALDYIKPLILTYIHECNIDVKSGKSNSQKLLGYQHLAAELICKIDDKKLEIEIARYIAPLLCLNNNLLEITSTNKIKEITHVKAHKKTKMVNSTKKSRKVGNIAKEKIVVSDSDNESTDSEIVYSDSD